MFDLENVKTFDITPEGKHSAKVSKVEFKTSKAGAEYLSLTFATEKGNVFHMMNINHPSEQPRNIALADLKKLLIAGGFTTFNFASKEALAEALYTIRCEIIVKHLTDSYGTKAVIKGYSPLKASAADSSIPF